MDKVRNEEQEMLPSNDVFNDYDMLNDTLASLKHLNTEYGMLVKEASNKTLSLDIDKVAKELSTLARESFNLMFTNGWYELTKEDQTSIKELSKKFSKKRKDF